MRDHSRKPKLVKKHFREKRKNSNRMEKLNGETSCLCIAQAH